MEKLILKADRQGYSTGQCGSTMTAGELIAYLEDYDEDTKVYLSHDNGYTYGSISEQDFSEEYDEDGE